VSGIDPSKITSESQLQQSGLPSSLESDPSLVALTLKGNIAPFEVLVMRHRRRMLSLAWRITGNLDDAEDIVQQVFIKAFINLNHYRGAAQFRTWLSRIAINEALMHRRRAKRYCEISFSNSENKVDGPVLDELRTKDLNPEEALSLRQQSLSLAAAISQLNPKSRIVLQLRDLQGHSTAETANLLGLSIPTVKARLIRSRRELRRELERHWRPPQKGKRSKPQKSIFD